MKTQTILAIIEGRFNQFIREQCEIADMDDTEFDFDQFKEDLNMVILEVETEVTE